MKAEVDFKAEGTFSVGCNYWASHAGTNMWPDWRPDVVAADFKQLSKDAGLQIVRVFPLWPDFQPLNMLKGGCGTRKEMRMGEATLGTDALGKAGISELMMERFSEVVDEAEKNGLKVIVGLLTGWMSGRLYVPPAFENLDVLTDPLAIMWEVKFVKAFVEHFKDRKGILAWEFGNECNCMGRVKSRDEAYLWASSIGNAIRAVDNSRPVISGMHSLQTFAEKSSWTMEDQGEITDVLTTHPYPLFTPHCELDPVDEMRNGLHATAESRLYGDIGGKPCMVEEIGTLGPMICSEKIAANYVNMSLMSSLANDCRSFIWWCAYDQDHLTHAPYAWNAVERELGIFRKDRKAKPIAGVFKDFRKFNEILPKLPLRSTEAVCVLTERQDNWGVAYASFILAKQAGFDIEFQKAGQKLKKSKLYLLPSVGGNDSPTRDQWIELIDAVKDGANLYVSCSDGLFSPFESLFGLKVLRRARRDGQAKFSLDFVKGVNFASDSSHKLEFEEAGAEVLGREADGNPCFASFKIGKGLVYFLSVPIESSLVGKPGSFHSEAAAPFWKLYAKIAGKAVAGRAVEKIDAPKLGITEHEESAKSRIAFLINYSSKDAVYEVGLKGGWKLSKTLWGDAPKLAGKTLKAKIPANSSLVLKLSK